MMAHQRDRDGKRTMRTHTRDDNWTKFEEYARQRESVGEGTFPISSRNPLSPTSGRLHKEDMALYGREPATDHMVLAVCEVCQRVVKSQAFARHRDIYHPETVMGMTTALQRVPIRTMGQSSGVLGGVATNGGVTTEGRRSKVLDLDKQCGVYIDNDKKYCKKSISCKIHSLEQRRKVVGRSRPLSELIAEYKKMKKIRKQEKLKNSTSQMGTVPPYMSPAYPPTSVNHVPVSPTSPFTPQSQGTGGVPHIPDSPPHPSIANYFDDIEVEQMDTNETSNRDNEATPTVEVGVSDIDLYPKPAAVCSFGRRVTKGSSSLFNCRLDAFRYSLVTLTGKEKDFAEVIRTPDASTRRKYSSSLNHRTQHKRKYAQIREDQNHFSLVESKYNTPSISDTPITTSASTSVTVKPSSFYSNNPPRRSSQSTMASPVFAKHVSDEVASFEDLTGVPRPQYQPKAPPSRRSSGITEPTVVTPHHPMAMPTSVYNTSIMKQHQQHQNHVMESSPSFQSPLPVIENSIVDDPFRKQQHHVSNHLDHWAESVSEATPTNLLQQAMKMAPPPPPGVNGVINSPGPHGTPAGSGSGGMVQPFSMNSQQTYLLNPSHQQPHLFQRGVVPIGLGVPHASPSSSYPSPVAPAGGQSLQMPLLYPGDKPELIQIMGQAKPMPLDTLVEGDDLQTTSRGAPLHDTGSLNNIGPSGLDHQGDRLPSMVNQYGFQPSKQFDGFTNAHHHFTSENYFNEFNNATAAASTTNQCLTPPTPYLLSQFGNQNSPNNLSRHSSAPPLALHQLSAAGGGLVQSSHAPPMNPSPLSGSSTPVIPQSPLTHTQPNNPIRYISPNAKQTSYLASSQTTGMVSPSRGPAHRTQQRVS